MSKSDSSFDEFAPLDQGRRKRYRRRRKSVSSASFRFKSRATLQQRSELLLDRTLRSSTIAYIGLLLYVALYSIDMLVLLNLKAPGEILLFNRLGTSLFHDADSMRSNAEQVKRSLGLLVYAYAMTMLLVHWGQIRRLFRINYEFILILGLVVLGAIFSSYPSKVLISAFQVFVALIFACTFAIVVSNSERSRNRSRTKRDYAKLVAIPFLATLSVIHAGSLALFFAAGFQPADYLDTLRYGGLSGNPNTAGGQAVIGLWCAMVLIVGSRVGLLHVVAIVCAVIFGFSILFSGSGTALLVAVLLVPYMLLAGLVLKLNAASRVIAYICAFLVVVIVVGGYFTIYSAGEVTEDITASLGKESSFTGRTELWAAAIEAIRERPLLGWSLDAHQTVMSERRFDYELNHYHNGFLDLTVAGGFTLLFAVLYNLGNYFRLAVQQARQQKSGFAFIGAVLILMLLNISEYSLLRPLSVIFQFYLCCFFLLSFQANKGRD